MLVCRTESNGNIHLLHNSNPIQLTNTQEPRSTNTRACIHSLFSWWHRVKWWKHYMMVAKLNDISNKVHYVKEDIHRLTFQIGSDISTHVATEYHAHLVHLTVKQKIAHELSPLDYGWRVFASGLLVPIATDKPIGTNRTLRMISWISKMGCGHHHCSDVIMGAMASQITSLPTVYSGAHQSSVSLAFVRGIHRWPVNSPHKWPVTRKTFPFDDVIMS